MSRLYSHSSSSVWIHPKRSHVIIRRPRVLVAIPPHQGRSFHVTVKYDELEASITFVHPALVAMGQPFMETMILGDQWMNYSFEFAQFIADWATGNRQNTPFDVRNFAICTRKTAYSQILLNPL